jgi:DNA adenine methylase
MTKQLPRPFLKYAGGKRWLAPTIVQDLLPKDWNGVYFEPFLGGGAVFWELCRSGKIKEATLSDCNDDLICAYAAVKYNTPEVIDFLKTLKNSPECYTEVRDTFNASSKYNLDFEPMMEEQTYEFCTNNEIELAARFIYMNHSGYNGLVRYSKKGKYNVPFDKSKAGKEVFADESLLTSCAENLKVANLYSGDFDQVLAKVKAGDLVYLDPPYVPVSKTSNFTTYTGNGFDEQEQTVLASLFSELKSMGVYAIASNSNTPLVRDLYKSHRAFEVTTKRRINSDASKRGDIQELLILNW